MPSKVYSAAVVGVEAFEVEIEVHSGWRRDVGSRLYKTQCLEFLRFLRWNPSSTPSDYAPSPSWRSSVEARNASSKRRLFVVGSGSHRTLEDGLEGTSAAGG
jgi:hypothetical protein